MAIAVIAVITLGLLQRYVHDKAAADEQVVRQTAQELLAAGRAWWSKYRTSPPSIVAMAADGLLNPSFAPVNPLGNGYSVAVTMLGTTTPTVVVQASITRPGPIADWQRRLEANDSQPGQVIWRRFAIEVSSLQGARQEAFKSMY